MYIEKNISFASHDLFSENDIAFQRRTFYFGNETRFPQIITSHTS